ncbi:MAG TPA: homoserine dehydrogenase [Terriglobales bacterium]|nr:homoserine dehydrogenase [Terriglobales bacterium]
MTTTTYNLALLGFGNVGRALVSLLEQKRADLHDAYGIEFRITGVATRRIGWIAPPDGLDASTLLRGQIPAAAGLNNVRDWLRAARADVLFEITSLNRETGQPAIDHLRAALEMGAYAITANKGPVVHGYAELSALAQKSGRKFLFESTVMDGVPIFCLFRDTLPTVKVRGFRAILNSTTNFVLQQMEEGSTLNRAIGKAQELGVAETDPGDDLAGWDASVKVAALVTVLMGTALKPQQVERQGIEDLHPLAVQAARRASRPYKLVCEARRENAQVKASVCPQQLPLSDPLAWVNGTSSAIYFETDIFPGLAITEQNPGVTETAYGLLADLVRAVGAQSRMIVMLSEPEPRQR